jgi:cell division protein FtsA
MSDIFELIDAHLKKIGKDGLLPAGIVITGGGAGLATIEDLARAYLKLPSRIARADISTKDGVKDATWSVAYGLCLLGLRVDDAGIYDGEQRSSALSKIIKKTLKWFAKFLP